MVNIQPEWDLVVAQTINFLILWWLFYKFLGKHLTKVIAERREMLHKADNAEQAYEAKIAEAEEEKRVILDKAVQHKQALAQEATLNAQQKADAILAQAEKQAENITQKAEKQAAQLESELQENFSDWVKKTAHVVLKKLFEKDVQLEEKYLDGLVKEFVK